MKYRHIPVMLREAIDYLNIKKDGTYIDCTLGGAAYTMEIAKRASKGKVYSFDADEIAISNAERLIKENKYKNIILIHDNFSNLSKIREDIFKKRPEANDPTIAVNENEKTKGRFCDGRGVDGIVFDLGLSSAQLEDGNRGFSFLKDALVDMAFGADNAFVPTSYILNSYKQADIEKIIKDYGEERFARNIAKKIVEFRKDSRIETTKQLCDIIASSVPAFYRHNKKINFATRTFQALRIATNDELNRLKTALEDAVHLLNDGGRIVVVSYHSLEDRIVKHYFKKESKDCICENKHAICQCNHSASIKIITKKALLPTEEEVARNPRSRSAKFRVAEKIETK